ncbi:MAG: DUF115 domain-containing protein [Treponema sp.]|jgi:hypothetical protein|nr:DUF115 domain-containing protein [Treponema sp.]
MNGVPPGGNGQGLSRQGKTLLSGVDPAGRAERVADAVPVMDRTLYLCPSPLYGYGLERLLARLAGFSHSAVLCIEADPELFALSREHFPPALNNSQKLRLTNNGEAETLCALLRREWGPRFFRRVEMVRLNGGWQLHSTLYDMLADSLRREIALDWGNAMTLTKLGRRYIHNALRNLSLIPNCHSLRQLSFGSAPALVLGAGPSLDKTLDGLQARFGRALLAPEKRLFRIICVDTCLPALKERGITVDLAVILESQHWNLEDFVGLSGWNVSAAFDLSALPRSAAVLAGGLFLFFTPWTHLNIFERLGAAGLLPASLPPLGSVGLSAAMIARRLTRGTIITAGLDFSFTLDSYHARSTPGHKKRLRRHNRFTGLLNTEAAFGGAVTPAVSKTGGQVFSSPSLRNYRDLFEREFAAASSDSRFFDIAGSGLPLGIKTLAPEAAFDILSAGNSIADNTPTASPCTDNPVLAEKLRTFIRGEQNRLTLLLNMLTGESAMDYNALAALIDECDYLWAHFPDYAAADRRPGKAELESGAAISFLKRLRVEIDPFLKLLKLVLQ